MNAPRKLRINWILAGASLAGGVKLNREMADAMVRRGHEVCIAYAAEASVWSEPWRPRKLAHRLWREFQLLGKQRHHLEGTLAQLVAVDRPMVEPDCVPDADVSIASWWRVREAMESWPAEKGMRVHLIRGYELHGGDAERVRATYRLSGVKVAVSHWLARVMAEEFGAEDVVRVPDGIEPGRFAAPPRSRNTPPVVGMMYSDAAIKGAGPAFEALRLVQERMPETRVIALGADPLKREHRPPKRFEFHLRPRQEEIPKLYRRADCWLVPSRTEGFGMPGLEAAASRCPVVSTRCGGPEGEYVREGENGHLVPVADTHAMAEAIVDVLTCEPERWRAMSEASHRIAQEYDLSASAAAFERVLLDALEHHRPAASGATR